MKKGELYVSSPKKFDKPDEDGVGRNDCYETVTEILQADISRNENIKVVIGDFEIDSDSLAHYGAFYKVGGYNNGLKLYSLTGLLEHAEKLDSSLKQFFLLSV